MAIEAEALQALSEKCPAPVKAVGRSLVVQQSEHRRFESYLGSPEMAQFLEALVNAYRDGSLIHRSALAEDTARAAEGMRERCERAALSLRQEPSGERHDASRDRAIGRRNRVLAEVASLIRALPLGKEAADANR